MTMTGKPSAGLMLMLMLITGQASAMIGLRPIGVTAASRAMAGTGVASWYNGYDAVYKNPALLAISPRQSGQTDVSFGMMAGRFTSRARSNYDPVSDWQYPEGSGDAVFPSGIGGSHRWSGDFAFGVGFYGGGGGADYGDNEVVQGARSLTVAFSLIPAMAMRLGENWAAGIALNASQVTTEASSLHWISGIREETGGETMSYGYQLGLAGQLRPDLRIGFYLQPPMTSSIPEARDFYESELRLRGERRDTVMFTALPLEVAAGADWQLSAALRLVSEVRFLQWSEAEFLKQIGWDDQVAVSLAGEYMWGDHGLRLGYIYCNEASDNVKGTAEDGLVNINFQGHPLPQVALAAIASLSGIGVTKEHYTMGTTHVLSETLRLDTGLVYMAPGRITRNGSTQTADPQAPDLYGWSSEFTATTLSAELTWIID